MPIYLGSTKINPLYFGGVKIAEAYLGSTKIYSSTPPGPYVPTKPYLIFEFSSASVDPSVSISGGGTWTQISSSPNRWYWERIFYVDQGTGSNAAGWPAAFSSTASTPVGKLVPVNLGGGTCKIVGYGNLTSGSGIQTMDRTFANCTGLTEFVTLQTPNSLQNVGGCFSGCTELVDGALDQYSYWSTYNSGISNHSGTFTDAGANTVSGLAELDQIPTGWGGNLIPSATDMSCARDSGTSHYRWTCGNTEPTWSTNPALYVFTASSVSQYSGVNMRKTNIKNIQNGLSTSGVATYYRIAFFQFNSGASGAISWVLTTSGYNGMLTSSQSAGDMPGTLDYSTYGATDVSYGTYDSNKSVFFGFLVTNADPSSWTGLTDAYGLQGNNYFLDPITIKWFV